MKTSMGRMEYNVVDRSSRDLKKCLKDPKYHVVMAPWEIGLRLIFFPLMEAVNGGLGEDCRW